MKKIEYKYIMPMVWAVYIDGKVYEYTGTEESAKKVAKNLDFVLNTENYKVENYK